METQSIRRSSAVGALLARPRAAPPAPRSRTLAIVGAGFCGTTLATHLLRLPHAQPLRIVLIERASAGGVAYARREHPYLLNVPAGRMSASSADPLEFLRYAQGRLRGASAADFLPRELYGQYLEARLASAARAAPAHVRLERVHGEVIALEKVHRAAAVRAWLESGATILADGVVITSGNPEPAPLPGGEQVRDARYVADPWQGPSQFRAGETLLVAGTGLTMADIVLGGQEAAGGLATVHAISRHGLLPEPQEEQHGPHAEAAGYSPEPRAPLSLRRLVRELRERAAELAGRGEDWRALISTVRSSAPTLWQRLHVEERRRFLRHVRSYWDVHRHRLAPSASAALGELRSKGRLQVHAGRILQLESAGDKVRVSWRARGGSHATTMLVDRVINCTGPQYDVRHTRERLLRSLLAQGMARPDPLGLGIATDECGALIDASGRAAANLHYLGPLLRARCWETTAVGELRVHAERLACRLAAGHSAARTPKSLVS